MDNYSANVDNFCFNSYKVWLKRFSLPLYITVDDLFQFLQGLIKTDKVRNLFRSDHRFNSYKVWLKQSAGGVKIRLF